MGNGTPLIYMRSLKLLGVLFAVFVLTSVGAFCGNGSPSVEEEFKSSKGVLAGTMIHSRDILDAEGFVQGTFYSIRVSEVLKGSPGKTVELYSENSSGRFPMKPGTEYLIFAYQGTFEGVNGPRLVMDSCGNSGALKTSKKALATARKLKQ